MNLLLPTFALATLMSNSSNPSPGWDWNVVIGTGQSLSVGGNAFPPVTTTQPFGNLMLSSGDLMWPVDPDDPKLTLIPLVEPCRRRATGYPSAWPTNLDGETAHSSAANQISFLVQQKFHHDYTTVHFEVGEAGQGMVRIRKNPVKEGVTGRAYEASILQTRALERLAKASGKTYGVSAILMTHGETDTGDSKYEDELYKLWSDYNNDIKALTGQKSDVLMIVSQHNRLGEFSPSTIAQWKIADDHPENIVCSGPKYQYPYGRDSLHMTAEGYRLLGEKYGEVYFERAVLGHRWRPLEPIGVLRNGASLTVKFHVPSKPLIWDSTLGNPHPSSPEWSNGKGFELTDSAGKRIAIQSASIQDGDTIKLALATDPGPNARLSYALVGEPTLAKPPFNASPHWGLLRDSDPFVGYGSHSPQPNFCVAFEMNVP